MSNDLMNISAFKGIQPAAAFKALDPHAESLADGIGSSYGIVGYKGKVWSLRLRGETHNFTRSDDGSPLAFLDVIMLRQLPAKSKSFYPPGSYVDGQVGTRPLCAALDGVTPDADIAKPESTACAICPRNVFKVSPDGRKTRDCSDYKRIAVLVLPSLTKTLLGAALMEPVFLRVPAASLNDLALLGEGMSAQGFHFSTYITRIGFNPEKPHPQMTFRALQPLADREAALVMPMREDPTSYRITGESDLGKARPASVTSGPAKRAVPGPTPEEVDYATAKAAQVAAANKAAQVEADRMAAHEATRLAQEAAAKKAADAASLVDTGFGDVGTAVTAPAGTPAASIVDAGFGGGLGKVTTAAAQNTDADVGVAEEADDDLDARIAGILPK